MLLALLPRRSFRVRQLYRDSSLFITGCLALAALLLATISTMTLVAVVIAPFFVFGLAVASLMSDLSASPAGFQAAPKWSYRLACSFRPVALGSTSHRPGP